MNDQDVRDLLRRRAESVHGSPDALDRIRERIDEPRRHRVPPAFLAVAALALVALVSVGLVARDDGNTSVEVGPANDTTTTVPGIQYDLLDAVWPSADEDDLRAISADYLRHQYPWPAASAYVKARLDLDVPQDGFTLVSGDATHAVLQVADGSLDAEIEMQRLGSADDPLWYVVQARNEGLSVADYTYDGARVSGRARSAQAGELTIEVEPADASDPVISLEPVDVGTGDEVAFDEALPDEEAVVARLVLRRDDGTISMSESMMGRDGWSPVSPPSEAPPGVWPWPDDAIDESVLDDPVDTARAYVASRILDPGATTASELQPGDSNSGEVVFTGDVVTTVAVRRFEGAWHVEAAFTELLSVSPKADGSLAVTAGAAGSLDNSFQIAGQPESERGTMQVDAGETFDSLVHGAAQEPAVVRSLFVLETADGVRRLAEVRTELGAPQEHDVPATAVSPEGGLDPQALAADHLRRHLGREPRVDAFEPAPTSDDSGIVTYDAGVVMLERHDGLWYVVEVIGDSVQLDDEVTRDGRTISGEVVVAEPGTLLFTAGDETWTIVVGEATEGTVVPFSHELLTSDAVALQVILQTDAGFSSMAARVI